ncbi:hypothetical protein M569_14799, partial [Genlisea aurea]
EMPSAKSNRKGVSPEKSSRRGVALPRASSFHAADGGGGGAAAEMLLQRPRTVPNLIIRSAADRDAIYAAPRKITKLLFNVTIQRSLTAVRLVIPQESTVEELIAAALRQYQKESRLPALPSIDSSSFSLHYSQFSLESLDREEKVMNLGSRNFFMC